ncbi:MAG TPA: hypothetical protein VF646_02370 [Cytophagales bacterium]
MLSACAIFVVVAVLLIPGVFGLVLGPVVPLVTGYLAFSYGRRFWSWVLLGSLLPVVAIFVLLMLPDRSLAAKDMGAQ